nr:hypothetical protein [uncultured Desulfobulbus sp.]
MAVFATGRHVAGVTLRYGRRLARGIDSCQAASCIVVVITSFDNAPYSYCVDSGMG